MIPRHALVGFPLLGLLMASSIEANQPRHTEVAPSVDVNLPLGTGQFSARLSAGLPGYAWLKQFTGSVPLAEEVDLYVQYPVKEIRAGGRSLEDAILVLGDSVNTKSIIAPEGIPPVGSGRPGVSRSTWLNCTQVTIGTNYQSADVEYLWEWRNTVDSTGDGKPDSNPDWVLVGMRVTFLNWNDASLCD